METITYRFKRVKKRDIVNAMIFGMLAVALILNLWFIAGSIDVPLGEAAAEDLLFGITTLFGLLACVVFFASSLRLVGGGREFLRLDDGGLTFGNLFGAHHWRWRDLSAFALHGKAGKNVRVTFAVPGKLARSVNQIDKRALIEDIYDTPLTDIAAKLNEFRERARADDGEKTPA